MKDPVAEKVLEMLIDAHRKSGSLPATDTCEIDVNTTQKILFSLGSLTIIDEFDLPQGEFIDSEHHFKSDNTLFSTKNDVESLRQDALSDIEEVSTTEKTHTSDSKNIYEFSYENLREKANQIIARKVSELPLSCQVVRNALECVLTFEGELSNENLDLVKDAMKLIDKKSH